MSRAALKALDEQLRTDNASRVERLRAKDTPAAESAPVDHAAVIAEFHGRHRPEPSYRTHVPTGRFCVRYRYVADRWVQVHRSATAEDRAMFIGEFDPSGVVILNVWEEAA